jgi:hypothetical protein
VPHEAVDLACRQLPLSCLEPTKVLRGDLPQTLRVDFLNDSTSRLDPAAVQQSG